MEMVMMKGVGAIVTDHPERIPAVTAKVNEEQDTCTYTDGNIGHVTDGGTERVARKDRPKGSIAKTDRKVEP